jgi:hypothetical protein
METHIEKALDYVRNEVDITDVNNAVCKALEMRMPVSVYAPSLTDNISDLLEEYGQDNDLPEGWWCECCDIDELIERI